MTGTLDWTTHSGDAWTRRWRETDAGLSNLQTILHSTLLDTAPVGLFRAMDIGCGPGSSSLQLARARPDATIIACDISPSLADLARSRLAELDGVEVLLGDAEETAAREGPFDLIYSRHGVMFFGEPVRAFRRFRDAAAPGARLVFSCFQDWAANPWASELGEAAAGRELPPPGREPSGFAFAESGYVRQILESAGWSGAEARPIPFRYVAGKGAGAIDEALDYLAEIGPAARVVQQLPEHERSAALARMRRVIERHCNGDIVDFPAAAWIWRAEANW